VTTNDFECGYILTKHFIEQGCKNIAYLSISNNLAIMNNRVEGYKKALEESGIPFTDNNLVLCTNDDAQNFEIIQKRMLADNPPDAMLASVEKLATSVYLVCNELNIAIPQQMKVACFSNLLSAVILNPSLTTITQPAFEMGKAAATLLFKALEKQNFNLAAENIVLPSRLYVRNSTAKKTS